MSKDKQSINRVVMSVYTGLTTKATVYESGLSTHLDVPNAVVLVAIRKAFNAGRRWGQREVIQSTEGQTP